MKVYHILCFIKLAAVVMFVTVLLLSGHFASRSDDQYKVVHYDMTPAMNQSHKLIPFESDSKAEDSSTKIYGVFPFLLYLALEIYIYACINSLFLEIDEETKPKGSTVSINQQRPLMTSQGHQPQYNATMHPIQPGPSRAVIIPLH